MPKLSTPEPARHPDPTVKARRLAYLDPGNGPTSGGRRPSSRHFGLQVAERTPTSLYLRGTAAAPYCYVVRKAAKPRFVGFGARASRARRRLERSRALPGAGRDRVARRPGRRRGA